MKIAFLVNKFPLLSETFILNQITGLLDKGHEVKIYSSHISEDTKVHSTYDEYSLKDKTVYTYAPLTYKEALKKLAKLIPMLLIYHPKYSLELFKSLRYGKDAPVRICNLYTFLNCKDDFDIYHAHFGNTGKRWSFIPKIEKKPFLVSFYGHDASIYIQKNSKYKDLFKTGDLFTALSEHMKKNLIELGFPEERIIVHHLGINPHKFTSQKKSKYKSSTKILTVARLVEKKGLEYSIRAFKNVIDSNKSNNIEYIIVGDGPLRSNLESLISELHMENNVKILGWKNQDELREIFNESDIFLLPSITAKDGDQEGTPTVLLEAMSLELPVISTLHAGIPEQVRDGVAGYLVPEKDVDALTGKIEYLIENPQLWAKMGKNGRKHVEENYDVNKLNNKLIEIYKQLMENKQ